MTNAASSLIELPVRPHHAGFVSHGFKPEGDGYRCGKLQVRPAGAGWIFSAPWSPKQDPLDEAGSPGLWRFDRVHGADCRVFALPGWLLDEVDADGPDASDAFDSEVGVNPFEAALDWIMAADRGKLPDGWAPPDEAALAEGSAAGALTIQQGRVLRHVEVVRSADRFALRMPLVDSVPADLSAARQAWLRRVLLETQARWLLVRTAITPDAAAVAVIDLTGVPESMARPLFLAGLESLRRLAAHLVETVEFLVAGEAGDEALNLCQPH